MVSDVAEVFLERFSAHDVDSMVELFEEGGWFDCVALQLSGAATTVGSRFWRKVTDDYPDFTVTMNRLWSDVTGKAAFVDTTVKGAFPASGKGFENRQLYIFEGNGGGGIIRLTCFGDRADWLDAVERRLRG
ncbi:MAG: nuclear transport factor 2 family protein [Geminicoccaceae bacterium]